MFGEILYVTIFLQDKSTLFVLTKCNLPVYNALSDRALSTNQNAEITEVTANYGASGKGRR